MTNVKRCAIGAVSPRRCSQAATETIEIGLKTGPLPVCKRHHRLVCSVFKHAPQISSPPTTQWWLVAPRFCERIASPEAGLKRARELERWARKTHGSQAGADCWVVAQRGDTLECGAGSGGHCVEDSFVQVGCAAAVERVRKEIWSACAVAHSI